MMNCIKTRNDEEYYYEEEYEIEGRVFFVQSNFPENSTNTLSAVLLRLMGAELEKSDY